MEANILVCLDFSWIPLGFCLDYVGKVEHTFLAVFNVHVNVDHFAWILLGFRLDSAWNYVAKCKINQCDVHGKGTPKASECSLHAAPQSGPWARLDSICMLSLDSAWILLGFRVQHEFGIFWVLPGLD